MISDYTAKVVGNKQLTETVFEPTFALNTSMDWTAGQYISLKVDEVNRRSYSICSLPKDNPFLSFCVDIKPNGPGSIYIKNLKVGDKVNFKGPLGKFTILNFKFQNYTFVATGTGVGPFKAMIPDLLSKTTSKVQLFFGVRHEKDVFYREFFGSLENQYRNFKFNLVLSETGKHVTDFNKDFGGEIYVCGYMNMIKDILMQHPNTHYESYY